MQTEAEHSPLTSAVAAPSPRAPLTSLAALVGLCACTPTNAAPIDTQGPDSGQGATLTLAEPEPEAAEATEEPESEAPQRPDSLGEFVRAHDGPVHLEFITQYGYVHVAEDAGQPFEMPAIIRLSADDEAGQGPRPGLDLAIVLDRSGSMGGDKLRFAKQAGLDLVNRLDDQDRVTLISYDDTVTPLSNLQRVDDDGIEVLRRQLLDIQTGGTTALGPALFMGLQRLAAPEPFGPQTRTEARHDRLRHVILLSDGIANVGETRPEVIGGRVAEHFGGGVSVSTLGMGLDYNEDLMTRIADEGGGRYHFIEDAESIPAMLGDELAGLTATVASEVDSVFATLPGTDVTEVYGYTQTVAGSDTTIRVGFLGAGQSREIVVNLRLDPEQMRGWAPGERVELGEVEVHYRLVTGATEDGPAPMRSLAVPATVLVAQDAAQARASERTEVTVRAAEVAAARHIQAASVAVDQGDFAEAQRLLESASTDFEALRDEAESEEVRDMLDSQLSDLEEAASSIEDARSSAAERKKYSKKYKASSYSKGKGSKTKKKKSVKKK